MEVELLDVWGIDFIGPLSLSSDGYSYIIVIVVYVSKWVEAIIVRNNEVHTVLKYLHRSVYTQFDTPKL